MRQFTKKFRPGQKSAKPERPKEQPIKRLEQIELIAKIATGVVALTYVSGYLIETTYLGTFGIHADAIEFFRAKYLYIGFHFWFSIVAVLLLLIFVKRVVDFFRALRFHRNTANNPSRTQREMDEEIWLTPNEQKEARDMLERRIPPSNWYLRPSLGDLRWNVIVLAIVLAFSFEIMFMDVESVVRVLPLQCILLVSIALQQFTHFRENYSYWGIVHGRNHVALLRLVGGFADVFLAYWILYRILHAHAGVLENHPWLYWVYGAAGLLFTLIASSLPFSFINSHRQMARFDLLPNEEFSFLRKYWRFVFGKWRAWGRWSKRDIFFSLLALVLSCAIFSLFINALYLAEPRFPATGIWPLNSLVHLLNSWRPRAFKVIGGITVLLAFYVPLNIVLLDLMRRDLYKKLDARPPGPDSSSRLSRLALQVVPITALYLVTVLSFAHIVYPKIPAEKAGGNYENARTANIHLIQGASSISCGNVAGVEQGEHIVIEEDDHWVYLAPLKKENCPRQWGKSVLDSTWGTDLSEMPHLTRPDSLLSLNRACIEYIEYSKRKTMSDVAKGAAEVCPAPDTPQP